MTAGTSNRRAALPGDGERLAKALDVIGNRSALLVLREALCDTTRFGEFVRRAGISEPATAARLRVLVSHGLLERETIGALGSARARATGSRRKGPGCCQHSLLWCSGATAGLTSRAPDSTSRGARSRGVPDWSSGQPRRIPASWLL